MSTTVGSAGGGTEAGTRTEVERIADLLTRAHRGDAWHGPSLNEALEGVTVAQATARPIAAAHSIWELVLHVTAWEEIVRGAVSHGKVPEITTERDWPPPGKATEDDWKAAQEALDQGLDRLLETMRGMTDADLERTTSKGTQWYRLLHGLVAHGLYHAGQMSVLRKG